MKPEAIQAFENALEQVPGRASYRMPGSSVPWSITPQEGRFLYDIAFMLDGIKEDGCMAFEVATAFGYSSCWIAMALEAGGLVTIDPYVEEITSDRDEPGSTVNPNPRGLDFARKGAAMIGVDSRIVFKVGFSPQDVPAAMEHVRTPIDLAFIDGHHLHGQPLKDWEAIKPYLHADSIVVFHDSHVPDVKVAIDAAEKHFGNGHVMAGTQGFGLCAVSRDKMMPYINRLAVRSKGSPYA